MTDAYYKFFPGDHARATGDLTLCEEGAYRRLLDSFYVAGRLPVEKDRLYRVCRAFSIEERAAVDMVVARFFRVDGDRLLNSRAEQELEARRRFLAEQIRKGKLGGRPRKAEANPEGKPEETLGFFEKNPGGKLWKSPSSPSPSKKDPKSKQAPRSGFVIPELVPRETWNAFEEHRNRLRRPMTDQARALIVAKLKKIGGSPIEILDQSIRNGWLDVFPLREDGKLREGNNGRGNVQDLGEAAQLGRGAGSGKYSGWERAAKTS